MMQSLQQFARYEAYQDSGVAWVKQIPAHWSRHRLGDLCDFEQGKAHEPFIDDKGIHICVNSRFVSTRGETIKYSTRNLTPAKKNDILMVMSDLPNGRALAKAYLVKDDRQYAVNQRVCRLTAKKAYFTYLYYLLDRHPDLLKHNDGSNQTHLTNANYLKLCVYLPPLAEQTAIANFLDQKTAEIDQAIALKTDLIERLKEYKQVTIQHAVTRGLDPNTKMKASGVEWIGDIPEGWGVKLGFLVWHENKRNNIGMKENQVLSLSYGKIVVKPVEKLVGLVPESFETYQIVEVGDIIIRCMDLQNDKTSLRIGIAEDRGIITSAYLNLKVNQAFCQKFIFYFLYSFDISKAIYKLGTGLRQNLSYLDFKRLKIVIPPLAEQAAIVAHIEAISAKIDQATDQAQQQINTLTEYKTILINAAVTGKIKVTDDSAQGASHAQ